MTKLSLQIPIPDTSQRALLRKWRIAPCVLVLTLGQLTCFAQSASDAPAQPASPDASKQLDAMQKHIEQLESELATSLAQLKAQLAASTKDKDKFAFGDFTWMLSNPRNHDEVLDGKYFSGEFRVDTNYMYDYSTPSITLSMKPPRASERENL
jgi:hypothetical protein